MELDAILFALLVLFFADLIWLLWSLSDDGDEDLDEFWKEIEREETELDEEDDRPESGQK